MARLGKRLSMDMPKGLFELIKENAKLRNITITKWILQAIVIRLKQEEKYE